MEHYQIIILVNVFIALSALWIGLWMHANFYKDACFNEYRFQLFKLRDQLSFLVMSGKIQDESVEHTTLLRLLNGTISATDSFRVTEFVRFLCQMSKNEQLENYLRSIKNNLDQVNNSEYASILEEFYKISQHKLSKDLKLFKFVVSIISLTMLQERKRQVKETESFLADKRKIFHQLTIQST